ncbi:MAG: Type 1 glutamine amidotransferase-like domain-containing protein [Rhodobacteraceae bacterium]|nr:Type 1 glutamine amidotransferase-like domain-containing protein [Paracoccaceae bacterium]
MKIIAIGGGGFTHDSFPQLDRFCLEQTGPARPRTAYIGTANNDDPGRVSRFPARFGGCTRTHGHLPITLGAADLARGLAHADIVYVAGGDTERMVARWRQTGWDVALADAAPDGVVLAGASARAVCWFDRFLFSAGPGPMRPLPGLGRLEGGACPHYSTEPQRRPARHAAVAPRPAFLGGCPVTVFGAAADAGACRVGATPQGVRETAVLSG